MVEWLKRLGKSEHERVSEMLSAYLDDELTPKERERVEAHLKECPACVAELRSLQQTVALLRELPPLRVPRSFTIRPQTLAERPRSALRAYLRLRAATALVAALLALVLAGDMMLRIGLSVGEVGIRKAAAPPATPAQVVFVTKVVEKVVEVTKVVAATVPEDGREATVPLPTFSPPPKGMAPEVLALPTPTRAAKVPTAEAVVSGVASPVSTPTPLPMPYDQEKELREAPPTPTATPVSVALAVEPSPSPPEARRLLGAPAPRWPSLWRLIEGGLALLLGLLFILTIVVRRRATTS